VEALNINNPSGVKPPINIKPPVNKGGGQYKYTVEQLSDLIDKFVDECRKDKLPPSQANFAVYAHVDEDTITNWKDKEGYSEQVKKLTLASKAFTQNMLFTMKNPAGAIFYGKNYHDMADKQEINVNNRLELAVAPESLEQIKAAVALTERFDKAMIEATTTVEGEFTEVQTEPGK
jgi:hypothetical protein